MANKKPSTKEQEDRYLSAIRFLMQRKLRYIDNTGVGGSLWVVAKEEDFPQKELYALTGLCFSFSAKGGRATKGKPAWYCNVFEKQRKAVHEMKWEWKPETVDEGRLKRAKGSALKPHSLQKDPGCAEFVGSEGNIYKTTLTSCTCTDFAAKGGAIPCKHILRLAMECGVINDCGRTPHQQIIFDYQQQREQLAKAFGYYHLFGVPIMSDEQYDSLRRALDANPLSCAMTLDEFANMVNDEEMPNV